jgi:HK97 family phage portal protein
MWDEDAGSRSAAGVRIDSNNAHQVAAVFSCLRVIAETVAALPLHVLERTPGGGKRIARELPLYRQLHAQPNGWQTSFEWREQAVFHVGLWGDAFSELKAGQIVPLHPSRMKIERVENGAIRYRYREDKGSEAIYSNDQILQIRGPSDDGLNGMRIVEECKEAIALARACEIHGARFFANGARPGFVLSTEGNLNAEARETLANQWDRRHGGPSNAGKTAVLTGGLKPYQLPQSSNSDAQYLELREYQLREIARLFRVPGHLLGLGTGSPQADIEFVTHTILPWLRRFESACTRDLIADDDRYLVEFDIRGLLRGDAASRASFMRSLWEIGALNTDEIRELENMDPVEGGSVRYRPLNMGTLGAPPSVEDVLAQQEKGSGIDGQAVEGGVAAAAGEPVVPATPGEPAETSLSTAEVSSLLTVVKQITDGMLTVDAARAIIAAAFPVLSAARVETILQGVAVKQEEPPQAPAAPAAAAPAARSQSVESRALTISMDFDRTFAADPTLWGEFARKAVADGNTVVMISRRPEEDRQTVAETLDDYADAFSQVLLVGGDTMKGDAAQAAGIDVDVWVDDSPQTITPAEPCDDCEDKPKSRSSKK